MNIAHYEDGTPVGPYDIIPEGTIIVFGGEPASPNHQNCGCLTATNDKLAAAFGKMLAAAPTAAVTPDTADPDYDAMEAWLAAP